MAIVSKLFWYFFLSGVPNFQAFVSCAIGTGTVGFVMMTYGVADAIGCVVTGYIAKVSFAIAKMLHELRRKRFIIAFGGEKDIGSCLLKLVYNF